MFKNTGTALVAIVPLTILLASCGVEYKVTKLSGKSTPKILPVEGIYYTLPKTEIIIRVPVTKTVITEGRLSYRFDDNLKKCKADRSAKPDSRTEKRDPTYEFGKPAIFTRPVPDPTHRYVLDVTAEAFSSFSHTVEVTSSGLLTSADSTVKDARTEAFLAVAKSLKDLAFKVINPLSGGASTDPAVKCEEILAAGEVKDELKRFEDKREDLLLKQDLRNMDSGTLKEIISYIDGRIGEIKKRNATTLKALNKVNKATHSFVLLGSKVPKEFTAVTDETLTWKVVALEKPVKQNADAPTLPKVPGGTSHSIHEIERIEGLYDEIERRKFRVSVMPSVAYADCGIDNAKCTEPETGGYRYRISAAGTITFKETMSVKVEDTGSDATDTAEPNSQETKDILVDVATATVPIAQFGPIAQLPGKFGGSEGNITLSVFSDTGAMKKITVGAKPQAASVLTTPIDTVTQILTQRQAIRAAEATADEKAAQEEADRELNELKREKDTLELRKAIRDLKIDLGESD